MRRLGHERRHAPTLPTWGRLRRSLIVLAASAGMLVGCADDLPKATEVARMRILGAQLSVVGDATRTTPAPGVSVRVAVSTRCPSREADRAAVRSLLVTCTAPDRFTGGIPICQELIDVASAPGASAGDIELPAGFDTRVECEDFEFASPIFPPSPLSANCKAGEPVFDVAIPQGYTADEVLFFGVVCERGAAVLDPALPDLFGCTDDSAEPIPLHGLIKVQYGPEDQNQNPDVTALRLIREITGVWEPVDPALLTTETEQGCRQVVRGDPDDPALPWVIGGLTLNLTYQAAARERIDGEPEELELSVFATDGDLERRFTLFRPEDKGRRILDPDGDPIRDSDGSELRELHDTVHWDSPKVADLPEQGLLVRFFVTVRDGRGGYGQADYALCALKQQP
jgi:hypothetical protein